MSEQATLKIDIWTRGRKRLPRDLDEAFAPHTEHVAGLLEQGYTSGQICDERFAGWWTIEKSGSRQ